MREAISPYGSKVRVLCRPADRASCDLHVQVQVEGTWQTVNKFNDFLDTEAIEDADRLASSLATSYATHGPAILQPETA